MDSIAYEQLSQIVGRLYIESQVEIQRLTFELNKVKSELGQALNIIKHSTQSDEQRAFGT